MGVIFVAKAHKYSPFTLNKKYRIRKNNNNLWHINNWCFPRILCSW